MSTDPTPLGFAGLAPEWRELFQSVAEHTGIAVEDLLAMDLHQLETLRAQVAAERRALDHLLDDA